MAIPASGEISGTPVLRPKSDASPCKLDVFNVGLKVNDELAWGAEPEKVLKPKEIEGDGLPSEESVRRETESAVLESGLNDKGMAGLALDEIS